MKSDTRFPKETEEDLSRTFHSDHSSSTIIFTDN